MRIIRPHHFQNVKRLNISKYSRHLSTQSSRSSDIQRLRDCHTRTSIISPITIGTSTRTQIDKDQSRVIKSKAYWKKADIRDNKIFDERNFLKFETLHELQVNASIAFAENNLFGTYVKKEGSDAAFEWINFRNYGELVNQCRAVLKNLGVQEFSKVGIISNNCTEWATIASATYSLNATFVPMYEAQLPVDWTYIINDAQCSVLFCATQDIYDRTVTEVLPQCPSVVAILCINAEAGEPHSFQTHMDDAKDFKRKTDNLISPNREDLANLIYTSGTTGKPKGVELMHSNSVSNIVGVREMAGEDIHDFIRQSDRSLAFLPWAHSYGMTCELWVGMAHGMGLGVCRGVTSILEDLQLVKPTVLYAVPTFYKQIYDGVYNIIESASPIKKSLMKKALASGRKKNRGDVLGFLEKMQYDVLDEIVLSKIRARFGGKLRHGFVAGAVCPDRVINFLDDVGIPIYEGYGLTETSPIITINSPNDRKSGTVGKSIKGVNVVIIGDHGGPLLPGVEGEICCYGPNVMRGYHNNPVATDEVMSLAPDGKSRLFHTGDLGMETVEGWVKVTGRLKEQYKLDNGKYVCPTPIEEAIGMSRFIVQIILYGANRPFNVALIVPDFAAIRSELVMDKSLSPDQMLSDARVQALIDNEIIEKTRKLKKFEIPQKWSIVAPFTASNNMLTPKMSIRRHMVVKAYGDIIAHMYGDHDNSVPHDNTTDNLPRVEDRAL